MFAVVCGNCQGSCPRVWVAPEFTLRGEQERFATREEAEAFIKRHWGEYPVECQ